jgi:hypothetical protein
VETVYAGMDVVLTGELIGFEGVEYSLQWYYKVNGEGDLIPIEGANDLTYTYQITRDNYRNTYHLGANITEFAISGE